MEFEPDLYFEYDSLFIFYWPLVIPYCSIFISAHSCFIYLFMDEFRLFSHLGFTYTTYITVKGEYLII